MTFTAGSQGANANPASAFMTTLDTLLTAAGFTFVESFSGTGTARVYKSPAASNDHGQDWYLNVYRSADNATQVNLSVAEVWDTGTKKYRNYARNGTTLTPTAQFAVNDATGLAPDSSTLFRTVLSVNTTGFQYWVSANANRVVIGTRVGISSRGWYVGLYDDLLPAAISPFPLAVVELINESGPGTNRGSSTREPNTTTSVGTYCFAVSISQTAHLWGPTLATADLYQGKAIPARVGLASSRITASGANGLRGLLKDVVYCNVSDAVMGDGLEVGNLAGGTDTYRMINGGLGTWVREGA